MAQTKIQIEAILDEAGLHPRRRWGQNFMIDQNLLRLVAQAGEIRPGDLVIEVGPGTGTLTEELLARDATVVAVEIDPKLAELLRARFADRANFKLIRGDALDGKHGLNSEIIQAIAAAKSAGKAIRLVANLPYNIASPLVVNLLIAGVECLAFTVQKEVAQRFTAKEGGKEYGPLGITAQMLAEIQILRTLPRQAFWPSPKIESALVRAVRRDRLGERAAEFGVFVQKLFAARRKTMRNSLGRITNDAEALLIQIGIDPTVRPENLSPETLWKLFNLAVIDRPSIRARVD